MHNTENKNSTTKSISQTKRRIGGIILAGGKSKRMGQSKPELLFGDETLLERVVRLTCDVVSPVVVAAASNQVLPLLPKAIQIVIDTIPDAGPLVGLLSGLRSLEPTCDAAFVVACDQPLITKTFIQVLIDSINGHPAVIIEHNGRLHPLTGVYRTNLLSDLISFINQGKRTAQGFATSIHAHVIDEQAFTYKKCLHQALCNINTPEDFAMLLKTTQFQE